MKRMRHFLIKRIFVVFCCTVLLSSNIFLAYETTVYASETEWDDALKAAIVIAGTIAGLFFAPEITLPLIIGALVDVGYNSVTIGKYFYENSDGTYTVSENLVQAVIDAAEELEARGFTDSDITNQKTERYVLHYAVTNRNFTCPQHNDSTLCTFEGMISMNGLSAMYISGPDEYGRYIVSISYASNSTKLVEYDKVKFPCGYSYNRGMQGITGHTYGANVPIFSDFTSLQAYLANGTGYKDAENYRPAPLFRRHSSYSPTYTGGSVTVNRTVINNINQKITEVDADNSLSDDQKIEILQQYIRSGVTPTPTPPPGPSDPDYDDNKDLPSGTDLTDTNSWLKKIYLKVCQIYAKMNAAVEDAEDAALAKIQESLDEIIVQLKKIKHWAAVDTVIDGVDAVADWLDLIRGVISDAKEGAGSAVAALSSAVGDSVDLMSKKFPFSVPWDILFFVSVLSAEPQVPHFEIPFNIEISALDITIDYDMDLDFEQFQWLSDLSRLLLSMTYAVGLLRLTFGVTSAGKEE